MPVPRIQTTVVGSYPSPGWLPRPITTEALRDATAVVLGTQERAGIDVKDLAVETPETVAGRIRRAVDALGPERVRYVHPDCGLWMLPRGVADGKLAALVAGRDLYGRG